MKKFLVVKKGKIIYHTNTWEHAITIYKEKGGAVYEEL